MVIFPLHVGGVLEIEPRAIHMLGKCSAHVTLYELHTQPQYFLFVVDLLKLLI